MSERPPATAPSASSRAERPDTPASAPPTDAAPATGAPAALDASASQQSPGGDAGQEGPPRRKIRAGRNLPAAIAVGVTLGAFILVPLLTWRAGFVIVICAAVAVGTFEVVRALRLAGFAPPLVPLVAGAIAMPVVAYAWGPAALVGALAVTVLVATAGRAAGRASGLAADLAATIFTAVYVGFLAGFAALLTAPSDGSARVIAFLATVVASDTGGYAAGVLSGGRHKLAPSVSPGKSWEGFAGSAVACMVVGGALLAWYLDGELWQGVLLGLAVVCTATVGDLGESLLKRDIGIKDMGNLLPGHGGIMDRLDSLLCTAPVAWMLISAFVPPS
ncbi:MAG: phosphatidate cytidylyltransferase [Frankia sp.]|nr:phosphatidate cytidylyltransferase [Frankia sp.]